MGTGLSRSVIFSTVWWRGNAAQQPCAIRQHFASARQVIPRARSRRPVVDQNSASDVNKQTRNSPSSCFTLCSPSCDCQVERRADADRHRIGS